MITAFIKTSALDERAGLWCQVRDRNGRKIDFQNFEMQNILVEGTADWKKYTLRVIVDTNAVNLVLGGYLEGNGTAWFDDFAVEDSPPAATGYSDEVGRMMEQVKDLVREYSIFSDSLNWERLDFELRELADGLQKPEEASILVEHVIKRLREKGDLHSFLQSQVTSSKYQSQDMELEKIEARLLPGRIGYLKVPAFRLQNRDSSGKFAGNIQRLIMQLDRNHEVTGWIVDLRANHGGNMYPMIAGLGPLLDEGTLGFFVKKNRGAQEKTRWFYSHGGAGQGETVLVNVSSPYVLEKKNVKVAVLIGPKTSSSGEMTAMSFIGRKNTQLFGEPTSGYTTANASFTLLNGSGFHIANSFAMDRFMKFSGGKIIPDRVIKEKSPEEDSVLVAAEKWLLEAF